ncbi:chromosome transmission fidelity protein 8 [[Candida] jaroonii]|uniref:Chromosome transmission fidelity protein 8 n=1 Tax=[Candida] jaroonii TaxID=467808 RepID=A0ACA9Y1Z1_9ASCO|nr:chromosome transmission fidelity protein 8 [[Candida] jaroonii]
MPSVDLEYSKVVPILDQTIKNDSIISTPYGLSILEIQGVLNLPSEPHGDAEFIKVDEIYDAVKFGRLQFDEKNEKKVTLFVSNSQRLLGTIEDLDVPLGVLKIPNEESTITMIDIIKKKIIFKQRPLPIM